MPNLRNSVFKQKGGALILLVFIIALFATSIIISQLNANQLKTERKKNTAAALSEAKTALIGAAIGMQNIAFPAYLPNPDLNLSSTIPEGSESGMLGAVDISLIGKLPWRSLDLIPLKDGWNECLWYVVSGTFKKSPHTLIFNWDTQGQIDVIDNNNNILAANIAALIISPSFILKNQNRSLASAELIQCGGNYDAKNYLDSYSPGDAIAGEVNYFVGATNNRQAPNKNNKKFVVAKSDYYNDDLVFITVNEIFDVLIKRPDFSAQIQALMDDIKFKTHLQTISVTGVKGTGSLDCTQTSSLTNQTFCENWSEMLLLTELTTLSPSAIVIDGFTTVPCTRVLIFAGKKTTMQARSSLANKNNVANYLEEPNLTEFNTPISNGNNFNGFSTFNSTNPSSDIMRCI